MPLDIVLGQGREKSIIRRHPWLFSGSVASSSGDASDGFGRVLDASGKVLGWALVSPDTSLLARMLTFGDGPRPDANLFHARIQAALTRRSFLGPDTTGYRVVHAEGDGLPGLVVDRYGDVVVVQASTAGIQRTRDLWLPALVDLLRPRVLLQKNNLPSRREEHLPLPDEVLVGTLDREPVPFLEHGLTFRADVNAGQKTGFYLDQRENRQLVRTLAGGRRLLECYAYVGAFGVYALAGGARKVVSLDSSARALEVARANRLANGLPAPDEDFVRIDVPEDLRRRVATRETWDLIVLDPPPFARKRFDLDRAARAYKDIERLALKLLAPGGMLLTCSCSGVVDIDLFQKILFSASVEAGVSVTLLERRGAGWDHPVSVDCPEGEYLKTFLVQRSDA